MNSNYKLSADVCINYEYEPVFTPIDGNVGKYEVKFTVNDITVGNVELTEEETK